MEGIYPDNLLMFEPKDFLTVLFGCVAIRHCETKDIPLNNLNLADNSIIINDNIELSEDDIYRVLFSHKADEDIEFVLARAMQLIGFYGQKLFQFESFRYVFLKQFPYDSLYKYVSNEQKYVYQLFNSKLFFASKESFNDIFDCCYVKNDYLLNNVRILCLSLDKDIKSLWGIYANSFKGFCFEYDKKTITNALKNNAKVDIACCSEMLYLDSTQQSKISSFNFSFKKYSCFGLLSSLTKCFMKFFIKDSSWIFEKEYRFVAFGRHLINTFEPFECEPNCVYTYDLEKMKPIKWNK